MLSRVRLFPIFLLVLIERIVEITPDAKGLLLIICCLHLMTGCSVGGSGPCVQSSFSYCFSSVLRSAFSQSSPNFNKNQVNTNWDWCGNRLSNPKYFKIFCLRLYTLFKKISDKIGRGAPCGHTIGISTIRSFKCSPYLWTNIADAQNLIENKQQSNTQAYAMQNKKGKSSCLWSLIQG
jgi:hypothetical protein